MFAFYTIIKIRRFFLQTDIADYKALLTKHFLIGNTIIKIDYLYNNFKYQKIFQISISNL